MKTGERWSCWKALLLAGLLLHAAGCLKDRAAIEKGLLAQPAVQEADATAKSYRVACPDVIELEIPQLPNSPGNTKSPPMAKSIWVITVIRASRGDC